MIADFMALSYTLSLGPPESVNTTETEKRQQHREFTDSTTQQDFPKNNQLFRLVDISVQHENKEKVKH